MARVRRRTCVALFLFALFLFGSLMGLRTLKPTDGVADPAPGLDFLPLMGGKLDRRSVARAPTPPAAAPGAPRAPNTGAARSNTGPDGTVFYDVHIFYSTWYGAPHVDGRYLHWDHVLVPHWDPKIASSYPRGRHAPPDDIGSSFYPELGAYSSRDPVVLEAHMEQIGASAAGVLVVSWFPPGLADDDGEPTEDLVPAVLDAAYRHNLKVTFHIQAYHGRNDQSVHDNVKYIIDRYGDHSAFYKFTTSNDKIMPLFYIYDSYLTSPESWSELLSPTGAHSLRGSAYDALFIALVVEERHQHDILAAGFDGMYTYFASNGFSFGSSYHNWKGIKGFCDANNLLFVPSVGPGYLDTSIRPWNNHNTRNRVNGRYYETALQAAMSVRPDMVTITSFNEWHEGTQIERAAPRKTASRVYLDYQPHGPDHFLELTRNWAEQFHKEKEQWLV